ncbi:MAG TPA: hypothetical protein VJR46_11465 [Candidatus Dormibacteraeota bacterium]|nr:hypothetical protein [Candidatus Dormibacteraeota bacterium]
MRPPSPIVIVPLRTAAAAPVAAPRLSYRGGPLLTAPEAFLLFWGDPWRDEPQATYMARLNDFFEYVVASPLIDQLGEYNVQDYTIGHGKRVGAIALTTAAPASVSDGDVRAMIKDQIASNPAVAQPTPNTLYFVFLPPGVTSELDGGSSCVNHCGYHNNDGGLYYAVLPFPDCDGCIGGLAPFDALTTTSSHELCEAITDPVPAGGWYDDSNGEIGDICAWQTKQLGGYTVQLEWSNAQGMCV